MPKKYTLKLDADQIMMIGTAIQLSIDWLGGDTNMIAEDKLTLIGVHRILEKIVQANLKEFTDARELKMKQMFGEKLSSELLAILNEDGPASSKGVKIMNIIQREKEKRDH